MVVSHYVSPVRSFTASLRCGYLHSETKFELSG